MANPTLLKRFWIIGISLIITATIILGMIVPIKDKGISEKKGELDDLQYHREVRIFQNHQDYLHYTLEDKIVRQTYILADAGNLSETDKSELYDEYLEARRLGLGKLHIMHIGSIPSSELSESWERMSYLELQDEINKVLKNSNLEELLDKIKTKTNELKNLEKNKTNLIIWITIIQVIGLVSINISEFLKNKGPS